MWLKLCWNSLRNLPSLVFSPRRRKKREINSQLWVLLSAQLFQIPNLRCQSILRFSENKWKSVLRSLKKKPMISVSFSKSTNLQLISLPFQRRLNSWLLLLRRWRLLMITQRSTESINRLCNWLSSPISKTLRIWKLSSLSNRKYILGLFNLMPWLMTGMLESLKKLMWNSWQLSVTNSQRICLQLKDKSQIIKQFQFLGKNYIFSRMQFQW